MNDFTKEELEEIEDGLILSLQQPHCDSTWANSVRDLRKKIQSMIDNYCEHESDGYTYYKGGDRCTDFLVYACNDSPCLLKCKKCGKLFDDGSS